MAKQNSSRSNQKGNTKPAQPASAPTTTAPAKSSSAQPTAKKTTGSRSPRGAPPPKPRISPITIGAVIVLAAAVVAFLVFWNQQRNAPTAIAPVPVATGTVKDADKYTVGVGVTPEGYPYKGNPNAKVTVENFSDYQCPFCAAFATGLEPKINDEFVNSGRAKFVFRDFQFLDRNSDGTPNLDGESHRAALAAHCALDQGAFWAYHDLLYKNQGKVENGGTLSDERLQNFAAQLGLNLDTFKSCMRSKAGTVNALINRSMNEAPAKEVQGTPTFFINGRKVESPDYDSIKAAIELAERNP
ncbi:MAG: thioredoxin domain-containing protein [Anaerolineae bacterium]